MTPILVLGAGGFLGIHVVDALLADGATLRCGRRPRSNVLALRRRSAPMVNADLDRPEELRAAMAGCQVVINAAGHYPRLSLDREGALVTARRQMHHVLDAAAATGVRRVVYLSSVATVAACATGRSDESARHAGAPGLGTYHDVKWSMETIAEAEDRVEVVVVCPGACLGPLDLRVGTSALLVGLARGLDPPHPDGVVNLIDVRDVGLAVARLAHNTAPPRRLILAAHDRQLHPLLVELARRYDVAPPAEALTAAAAQAIADREERRAAVTQGRPLVSREIVDLVVHGVRLDARLAETHLGMRWTPLDETLDAFERWARRVGFIPALRGAPPPTREDRP